MAHLVQLGFGVTGKVIPAGVWVVLEWDWVNAEQDNAFIPNHEISRIAIYGGI